MAERLSRRELYHLLWSETLKNSLLAIRYLRCSAEEDMCALWNPDTRARLIGAKVAGYICSTLSSLMWSQPPNQIRAQLHKVLASAAFAGAERMRRFLEFVVEHTLSSPNDHLKAIIIGIGLYAGHGEFDPRITAIVRVDASRLRTKLREYYLSEGAADALIIELPKGSYTPVFRKASTQADTPRPATTPPRQWQPT